MTTTHHNYKMFSCFNRKFIITEPGPPPDLKNAFSVFSAGSPSMSADHLRRFLAEHQGEEADFTDSDIDRIVGGISGDTQGIISVDELFRFLLRDHVFNNPLKSQVHHDMNAPLSHYFIYTGHNSYLTGNQLSSDCSDLPIIKALQQGVRVIELDLWPNSTEDDIDVVHGRTLTSPVSLAQCLKSIKEYAFVKSPYPVIITFEDHLTSDLQAKVAKMAIEIFGDLLYYPETDSQTEFPSPESLKGRILISTKPPKEYLESKQSNDNNKDSADEVLSATDNADELETEDRGAPEYKRLITIHAGKPKGGDVQDDLQVVGQVKRLSLSEQKLEKACECYGADIVRFTQKNILRVYPKGTRVTSSNYKPHIGWTYGAQMVALNMQGHGKSLWYMQGMFSANGGCGYVKKPEFLLQKGPNNEVFDPKRILPVMKTLKVKVYMGTGWSSDFDQSHFDSYSPPDFYTKVCIVGVPADKAKKKTKEIKNNWFPVWDEEFEFSLTVPELALLRIEVREHDTEKDDFGGQTCLPVSELKPGFRSVPLYDEKGEKLKSVKLLMRFQFI